MERNDLPLISQKGCPYEDGIRVPLIVKWPGDTDKVHEDNRLEVYNLKNILSEKNDVAAGRSTWDISV